MSMYRAKIQWREGSCFVATTVTVVADSKQEAENAYWRKFREHFGAVPEARIVARWSFDPPPQYFGNRRRNTLKRETAMACHAWPLIIANLTPGQSWGLLGSAIFAALSLLALVWAVASYNSSKRPSATGGHDACADCGCGRRMHPTGAIYCPNCEPEPFDSSPPRGGWRIGAALLALAVALRLLSWSLAATFHASAELTIRDDDQPLEHCSLR